MFKLYFGSTFSTISTLLLVVFGVFFAIVLNKRHAITHWGWLVAGMFFLGMFMSMMSGMKDGMGSPSSLIPMNHWSMLVLCLLGGLAFLLALVTLFVRKQDFWQVSFYILSVIVIVKVVITEGFRIADFFKHLT